MSLRTIPRRHADRWAAALLVAATAACSGDSTGTPEPSQPGVNIISGAALTDTILALPTSPLRVRVRGTDGKPRPGVEVRFRSGDLGMNLVDAAGRPLVIGVDTTDSQGYASALVRFGMSAGPARVVISVPALGAQDTASYTVLPGAPATLTAGPADSTVYAGGSYRLRGIVTDRFWNPLTVQQPVFTALSGPVSVRDGIVTGEQLGRGRVEARLGTLTDTADVSVVPRGALAVRTYNGINGTATEVATVQLDGSQMRAIAPGLNRSGLPAQGVAWSPNGAEVLLSQATGLTLADPAGAGSRMVLGQVTRGARFSRDGQWIYFSNMTVLFRVRPDGSGLERVDPGHDTPYNSTYNYAPSPSPDGRHLAYVANPGYVDGETFVRILDVATRTRVGFSLSGRNIGWSPTGDLVYHDRNDVLRLIRPDGTLIRDLGAYGGRVAWFDWSPDGRWLLVAAEWGLPVILIDVTTGLRLPLAWTSSMSESAWRP